MDTWKNGAKRREINSTSHGKIAAAKAVSSIWLMTDVVKIIGNMCSQ
jgi:hypothetical protein